MADSMGDCDKADEMGRNRRESARLSIGIGGHDRTQCSCCWHLEAFKTLGYSVVRLDLEADGDWAHGWPSFGDSRAWVKIARCCSAARLCLALSAGPDSMESSPLAGRSVQWRPSKLLWVVHIGALVIRVGLWDKLYCTSKKEPPKS